MRLTFFFFPFSILFFFCVSSIDPFFFASFQSKQVLMGQEMYNNFEYAKPKDFFHTFEGDDMVYGISFADVAEANEFFRQIQQLKNAPSDRASRAISPPPGRPPPPRAGPAQPSSSPAAATPPPTAPSPSSTSTYRASPSASSRTETKKKGFFSSLFSKDEDDDKLAVSEPSNFRHVSSIGWNATEASFEVKIKKKYLLFSFK
jgi:Wiskott-Aldrich syndrome protein